jgi:hypothetical protein
LIAFGGALPSQVLREAQTTYVDALQEVIALANDTVRLKALVQRYESALSSASASASKRKQTNKEE